MIEQLAVALIVTLAALHAAARYLPASWRAAIVRALARAGLGWTWISRWFGSQSGCGSGDAGCKSCADRCAAPHPDGAAQAAVAPEGGRHRVIPIKLNG